MNSLIVLIACAVVLVMVVVRYELKVSKTFKKNIELANDNIKMAKLIRNMSIAGDNLLISYKALIEVAKTKMTDKEINDLLAEKMEDIQKREEEMNDGS